MKPGRELDALVAEKVMGLTVRRDEQLDPNGSYQTKDQTGAFYTDGMGCWHFTVPKYSTNIAAAWEVVEKMHMSVCTPNAPYANGEYANQGNLENPEEKYEAECTKLNASDWSDTVYAYGLTAPHAICLAALKATKPHPV